MPELKSSESELRTDWRRYALDSMPPEHREAGELAKAEALFRLACDTQDALNMVGIYYGDGKLLDAKKKIDAACEQARNAADRIRHRRR